MRQQLELSTKRMVYLAGMSTCQSEWSVIKFVVINWEHCRSLIVITVEPGRVRVSCSQRAIRVSVAAVAAWLPAGRTQTQTGDHNGLIRMASRVRRGTEGLHPRTFASASRTTPIHAPILSIYPSKLTRSNTPFICTSLLICITDGNSYLRYLLITIIKKSVPSHKST